jgi:hypothetical protein
MKQTASAAYNRIANGSSKELIWKVYARKTANLNDALTGTWTEISSRVDPITSIRAQVEYQLGQFSADSIELVGKGIQWFKTNLLDDDVTYPYTEVYVTAQLTGAADIMPMFIGFVDKIGIKYNELTDQAIFTVFTALDLGNRLTAETITTQYLNPDVDGSGTDGLVLQGIKGIYVTDANVTSYVLKNGIHTISYSYGDGATRWAKLDAGENVTLAAGSNTLANAGGTQKVTIYIKTIANLPEEDCTDKIIVVTEGTTLPKQYYRNATAKYLLGLLNTALGLLDTTFGVMAIDTFDGNWRAYNFEQPPNDIECYSVASTLIGDGTDLYISVGNRLYKRNLESALYTYVTVLPGNIARLFYNARNNDLWIIYIASGGYNCKVYDITGASMSAEVVLPHETVEQRVYLYAMELVDYNYTGTSYKYGLLYCDRGEGIRFVDAGTLTPATITTTYYPNTVLTLLLKISSSRYWFKIDNSGSYDYSEVTINSSGNFVDNGLQLANVGDYTEAIYSIGEARIYLVETGGTKSHTLADATKTTHTADVCYLIEGGGYIWGLFNKKLYRWSGTDSATLINTMAGYIHPEAYGAIWQTDRIYGIINSTLTSPKLYQIHTTIPFFVVHADFTEMAVSDAIRKILNTFFIALNISATKVGLIYRRGNSSGVPITSGNTLTAGTSLTSSLDETSNAYPSIDFISVSGESLTVTYDGTIFDTQVFSNKTKMDLSSDWLSDQIVKDVAKYVFTFFSAQKIKYTINLGCIPLFQYEPFDGCVLNFTTTKIVKSGTGVITAVEYTRSGDLILEVLI